MNLYDKDLDRRAAEAGLEELLAYARALSLRLKLQQRPLPKSETRLLQRKKPYRQSKISSQIRGRIMELFFGSLGDMTCQKIADIIYLEFGQSISKSTVSRIINGKYKPKAVR